MRFYTKEALFKKANFTPVTTKDIKKGNEAYKLYVNAFTNGDSGAFGKAVEILTRRPNSNKKTVARVNENDTTVKINGKLIKAESKTNGGRIANIGKSEYIVYTLDVHRSNANITIEPKVMKTETFLTAILSNGWTCNIKNNRSGNGLGIDVTKRDFWAWLENMPTFDHSKDYAANEIL